MGAGCAIQGLHRLEWRGAPSAAMPVLCAKGGPIGYLLGGLCKGVVCYKIACVCCHRQLGSMAVCVAVVALRCFSLTCLPDTNVLQSSVS